MNEGRKEGRKVRKIEGKREERKKGRNVICGGDARETKFCNVRRSGRNERKKSPF